MSNPAFDTAMSICVGLDLGLVYGLPLLGKAGYTLEREDRLPYKMLLAYCQGHTIFVCNEFLAAQGARLLREREYRDFMKN
jgi:hypothetical protein